MEQIAFSLLSDDQQTEFLRNLMTSETDQLPNYFHTMSLAEKKHVLKALLRSHCEVTFTKVDGSIRTMPCTLRTDSIPQESFSVIKENTKPKRDNPETISVWCLDKQSWRSFRIENVISIRLCD